ncbi:MAG TPA: response regulator [Blastocatellia bacterium]|nr:response regulator [Blastocatellia bacterium]HMV82976.1 response regulator [Blastocatellia bacterium]HMX27106.1 response regulator [Blastocatellia bacterium]HMY71492.1 response regulator [Blastocatellia bacterium]HMZ17631.1 response regulator [Blastocatellia bacterium]
MDTRKVVPPASEAEAEFNDEERNLYVKIADELANQETSDLVPSDSPKKEGLVLVVDDNVDNIALLSLDLRQEGYRVVTASDGEEAIRVASLMRPDVILMDIGMPLLDGLGATTKIREDEELRGIPIIAVTAFSTAGFRRAAYDVGFDGYLAKPIDFDQLHELIDRLLA